MLANLLQIKQLVILDLREEVVDNVELNNTMEQFTADEAEVSVDSGQGTLLESPGALLKVLSITVVVVKVGDGDCALLVTILSNSIVRKMTYQASG